MKSASLDAPILATCVSAAVAAPSIHNTQPWRFRLDPATVTFQVFAAPERGLRHIDPTGRALYLSVGACVFNLRVALAHFGWAPVTRLLPCPENPRLFATVRPTEPGDPRQRRQSLDLYAAIWRRHSSRFPFCDMPILPNLRGELGAAARAEGARLTFAEATETDRLLRLTAEAEQRSRLDVDRATEGRRWVHHALGPARDVGVPLKALGPQDAREHLPVRDFTAQRHPERLVAQPFEKDPVIAVLATEHDRRADWLRAGQALQHVWLLATAHGLRMSLLHQGLEWPDLRESLSPATDRTGHTQLLMRLGHGPEGAVTPRRTPGLVVGEGRPNG